jgi:16S rRNA G966 N2-methylase RsmD
MTAELAIRDAQDAVALIDDAERALALVSNADEADLLFRRLKAIDHAVRLAKTHSETQLRVGKLKFRAERKWGELLGPAENTGLPVTDGNGLSGAERISRLRARQVFEGPEDVFENYLRTVKDPEQLRRARLLRIYREWEAEQRATVDAPIIPDGVDIRHCSVADLEVDRGSVALVFADPPYPAKYLPAWEALAEFAARALMSGRLLVAYSGQYHLPEVMYALECELQYVWLGTLVTPGHHNQVQRKHVRSAAKPLLFYSAGEYQLGPWFEDAYISERKSKEHHEWEQSLGAARYFIETLTSPGETVVDPFLGSGTTAVAAHQLGRRFIGCDTDEKAIFAAKERLQSAA